MVAIIVKIKTVVSIIKYKPTLVFCLSLFIIEIYAFAHISFLCLQHYLFQLTYKPICHLEKFMFGNFRIYFSLEWKYFLID